MFSSTSRTIAIANRYCRSLHLLATKSKDSTSFLFTDINIKCLNLSLSPTVVLGYIFILVRTEKKCFFEAVVMGVCLCIPVLLLGK